MIGAGVEIRITIKIKIMIRIMIKIGESSSFGVGRNSAPALRGRNGPTVLVACDG